MRYLAQVQISPISGNHQLQLLAQEQLDGSWKIGEYSEISFAQDSFGVGMLVIVKLDDEQQQILSIKNATGWLLDIIEHHFEQGVITPEFVQKEQEKIEIWRQEITSQSQDLTRRQLEIETRREQLEELEKKLAE
jgi:hypothetical protein